MGVLACRIHCFLLSVCKGLDMKDCINVQSIVFQIIIDNISLNGHMLQW